MAEWIGSLGGFWPKGPLSRRENLVEWYDLAVYLERGLSAVRFTTLVPVERENLLEAIS